jgi:hypothetical protein
MLRWLFYVVLALWASRLIRLVQPRAPRGRMTDFDPGRGAGHPSTPSPRAPDASFTGSEIVDGDYEDIPSRRKP